MKKILFLCLTALFTATGVSYAQDYKELAKERKEIANLSKDQLKSKATKEAKKEAKKLQKAGWVTTPGALPIVKQLDKSYLMQYEFNDDLTPKYIMGEAMSIAGNYDAAKMQALELAKQNLAGQIESEINALIESTIANQQLSEEEAATVSKTVIASKNKISQKLGKVLNVMELYRELENKNKEVLVRIAYSSDTAFDIVKETIREELIDEGEELHKKLDAML